MASLGFENLLFIKLHLIIYVDTGLIIGVLLERMDCVEVDKLEGKVPALKPIKFPNADVIVIWGLLAVAVAGKLHVAEIGFVYPKLVAFVAVGIGNEFNWILWLPFAGSDSSIVVSTVSFANNNTIRTSSYYFEFIDLRSKRKRERNEQ